MTPSEAAQRIGCTPSAVRSLIRRGKLPARLVRAPVNQWGWVYDIDPKDVAKHAKTPQSRGWPRGKPRKEKRL